MEKTKKITLKEEQAILDRTAKYMMKNLNPLCPHVIYGFLENLKLSLQQRIMEEYVDEKFNELTARLNKLEKDKEVKTNGKK